MQRSSFALFPTDVSYERKQPATRIDPWIRGQQVWPVVPVHAGYFTQPPINRLLRALVKRFLCRLDHVFRQCPSSTLVLPPPIVTEQNKAFPQASRTTAVILPAGCEPKMTLRVDTGPFANRADLPALTVFIFLSLLRLRSQFTIPDGSLECERSSVIASLS